MRLHVLSDLHCEFASFEPDRETVQACDVVVLAGDINKGIEGIAWARKAFGSKPVVYVCGNHEFYGHHWTELLDALRDAASHWDVHFLEDRAVDIEGVRFLGCALWTDFRYFRHSSVTGAMRACERGLNDFRDIRASPLPVPAGSAAALPARVRFGKRLTAQHVRLRHRASVNWLRNELQEANRDGLRPIVVTHHLPSSRSVPREFQEDELTPGYASHLDDLIPAAKLWIHGHVHESFDYVVAAAEQRSRVVCNPRGYPLSSHGVPVFENGRFRADLIVEC